MAKNKSYWNSLSFRLSAAFLVISASGIALAAVLAYRSGYTELDTFINHMGGMMGGMMGYPLQQARQEYLAGIASFLWVAGAAGVVLSLVLGWLFSRQIAQPLDRIAGAAHKVASGDLDQKVETAGYGEVQDLGESFNNMAATLRRDREVRRNMMADIAHELRTPLSVLQGNIEGMIDGVLPQSRETLDILHGETLELSRLVEDLRTLSLAEAGQLKFELQPVDLGRLVERVADGFRAVAASRKISIELSSAPNLPPVSADPDRTAQVLRNLIDNALKFSPDAGRLDIAVKSDKSGVTVSVADHGPGIPEKSLPLVFERFYRVDPSRSRATGGSGLGLAIARQLIEAQSGTIKAESKPGEGSTFSFTLPIAKM